MFSSSCHSVPRSDLTCSMALQESSGYEGRSTQASEEQIAGRPRVGAQAQEEAEG